MLLALKTTNTLAATSSKFHCSIHHALGSQKENNTNLLDVAAWQKRIKLSRARLIPTSQFCQVWPGNSTHAIHLCQSSTDLPSCVRSSVPLLLEWFQLFFVPAPCFKTLVWVHRAFTQPQKGWLCEAAQFWVPYMELPQGTQCCRSRISEALIHLS